MLAELNMDSLLSIQDQYLNAMVSILSASQQQEQQVARIKQQPREAPPTAFQVSTSGSRCQRRKVSRFQQQQQQQLASARTSQRASSNQAHNPAGCPLDLSTRRSADSSPTDSSGAGRLLASIIPQSTPQQRQQQRQQPIVPLDLVTKHEPSPAPTLMSSSVAPISRSSPSSSPSSSSASPVSSPRPSSTGSSLQAEAAPSAFQDRPSGAPNGHRLDRHSRLQQQQQQQQQQQSDRLISSSGGRQQPPRPAPSTASKKSSKGARSHPCQHCGRAFSRSDMLTRHSRLHSGLKPYQCAKCLQVFSRSDHLSTHERTHTGEKPYQCNVCSYSACRRDMITRHMRTHAMSAGGQSEIIRKKTSTSRNRHPSRTRSTRPHPKQLVAGLGEAGEDDDISSSFDFSLG